MTDERDYSKELREAQSHSTRVKDIDLYLDLKPLKCGLPTFEYYNYLTVGEGNLVTIAGRPGSGKTSLALQIGMNVAKHSRVLMFSLEMGKGAILRRALSNLVEVPHRHLKHPGHASKLEKGLKEISTYKFDIIDKKGLTAKDIISIAYDEYQKEPYSLVILDYAGLIGVSSGDARHDAIGLSVVKIREQIADRFKIPFILISQMTRSIDSREITANEDEEVRPVLSDLSESRFLEQASDVVLFLRPKPGTCKIYCGKSRDGEIADCTLDFSGEITKFFDSGVL